MIIVSKTGSQHCQVLQPADPTVPGPFHISGIPCLLPIRVCGDKFAEVPFVATREGYRRAGLCKVLIKVCPCCALRLCWVCSHAWHCRPKGSRSAPCHA